MPTTIFNNSFENPDLGTPVDGYDNFDDAFGIGSPFTVLSASAGGGGDSIAFITDGNTLGQPDAPDGQNYTGLHATGTGFQQETLQIQLTGTERIIAGKTYTIEFQSALIDVFVFDDSGQFDIYGVEEGASPTLNSTTITDANAIGAVPDVDLLGTSAVVSNQTFGTFSITFTATATYDRIIFAPDTIASGQNTFLALDDVSLIVVCFTEGTLIKTADGEVAVETLKAGDAVLTLDRGPQSIRWIGGQRVSAGEMAQRPKLRPIRISRGALGPDLPSADLRVSPQHRVLVRSEIAKRMFGQCEVLIPANKLLAIEGIDVEEDLEEVTYFHMLFDGHEIIFSNDAPTESLFTGPEALKAVSPEARDEIETLFPEITAPDFRPVATRFIPEKGARMRQLAHRHRKNNRALIAFDPKREALAARQGHKPTKGALLPATST